MQTSTKTRRRAVRSLGALLGVFFLVVVALIAVISFLSNPHKVDMRKLSNVIAVELGETWASYFDTQATREEQQTYLSSTLDEAQQLGANTVLLTGRVSQNALLFRTKLNDAPQTAQSICQQDSLFSRFDPILLLMQQAKSRNMQVAVLATDETGAYVSDASQIPNWLQTIADDYRLNLYTLQDTDTGLAVYTSTTEQPTLLRMDDSPGMLTAAYQTQSGYGLILGSLDSLVQDSSNAAMTLSFLQNGDELPDIAYKEIPQTLAIVSPDNNTKVYTEQTFLMGTSDPNLPLTVNGQEVVRYGTLGVWGLAVTLTDGENTFTAQQGDTTVTITLTKPIPSGGGGTTSSEPQSDGSVAAEWGQKVRVTSTLASELSDYTNADSITMTAYQGAVAEVANSVSFVSGNKITYAYQLHNGSYLLAKDCELLDPGTPDAAFTGISTSTEGNTEYLAFVGSGTPFYTHAWEGNTLTLHFYSASFSGTLPDSFGFSGASATVTPEEHGFALELVFDDSDPLWGYLVDYLEDGTTRIALKHQPHKSDDAAKPLTGITVMLDPGHGDTDMGAPGTASTTFPMEKDLNLSAALAAKHRLEQLGATVLMTRDSDVFYELGERMQMLNQQKPDFFISVHHNSVGFTKDVTDIVGTEAYWFYTESKPLASNLVSSVCTATNRNDRGAMYRYFYVTRSNICPAVLLELGFVSSPIEYESCAGLAGIWAEGGAIAQAVYNSIPD